MHPRGSRSDTTDLSFAQPALLAGALLHFLRRWLWLIVLGPVVGGVVAYLVTASMPRLYAATSTVFVTGSGASLGLADTTGVLPPDRIVATYAELVKSRPVVEAALSAAGAATSYDTAQRQIDVVPRRDAQVIQITVRASDPSQAAEISNQLVLAANQQTNAAANDRLLSARTRLAELVAQRVAQLAVATRRVNDLLAQPADPSRDNDLARAQTELTQAQQSYAAATRSLQDLELTAARAEDALSVLDPALPVLTPTEPRVLPMVLMGSVAGLVLAVGAALVGVALSDSLALPQGLAHVTGLPLLGSVFLSAQPPSLEVLAHTALVDCFRRIRTLTLSRLDTHSGRIVLLTSGEAHTGTTTIASGLAIALANAGERVVLVDANLRAPRLDELFGLQPGMGLAHLLTMPAASARNALVDTSIAGVRLVPSGRTVPESADALASPNMRRYLGELRDLADVVLVDGPPLDAGEGSALADLVDAIVLVFDAPRIRGRDVRTVMAQLSQAGPVVLGFVLNRVHPTRVLTGVAPTQVRERTVRLSPVRAAATEADAAKTPRG